jgi:hypothetical protein
VWIGQPRRGEYELTLGHHDEAKPLQAQVVAYGADSVRCKFRKAHEAVTCQPPGGALGICSRFFVSCHTPAGALANSQFVFSFSGSTINGTEPGGRAAFVETKNEIEIQKRWVHGLPIVRGNGLNYLNTHGGGPTITKLGTGYYAVTFPGLATSTVGVAQVTAIGGDAAHCKANLPYAEGSDLKLRVACYAGASDADSDFILNYDRYATRPSTGYQGARAHGDQPSVSSYTPARSWNSGNTSGPGENKVSRSERGRYSVVHSILSEMLSSAWVSAAGVSNRNYCKLEGWFDWPFGVGGVVVNLRCHASDGDLVDTQFVETYQGTLLSPW